MCRGEEGAVLKNPDLEMQAQLHFPRTSLGRICLQHGHGNLVDTCEIKEIWVLYVGGARTSE